MHVKTSQRSPPKEPRLKPSKRGVASTLTWITGGRGSGQEVTQQVPRTNRCHCPRRCFSGLASSALLLAALPLILAVDLPLQAQASTFQHCSGASVVCTGHNPACYSA